MGSLNYGVDGFDDDHIHIYQAYDDDDDDDDDDDGDGGGGEKMRSDHSIAHDAYCL